MGSPVWYATQAAKLQLTPSALIEQGDLRGEVLSLHDHFVLSGVLTTGDVINMSGLIPEGARIVAAKMAWSAQGGAAALSLGWPASAVQADGHSEPAAPTALINDVAAVAAGGADMFATNPQAPGYQYVLQAAVQPQVSVTVAGTAVVGSIDVEIEFVVD
jgi:hypothetical protein